MADKKKKSYTTQTADSPCKNCANALNVAEKDNLAVLVFLLDYFNLLRRAGMEMAYDGGTVAAWRSGGTLKDPIEADATIDALLESNTIKNTFSQAVMKSLFIDDNGDVLSVTLPIFRSVLTNGKVLIMGRYTPSPEREKSLRDKVFPFMNQVNNVFELLPRMNDGDSDLCEEAIDCVIQEVRGGMMQDVTEKTPHGMLLN